MSDEISVKDRLKRDFGVDLPISGGWGNSIANAVVIHYEQPNDYTIIEYTYLNCLSIGRQITWRPLGQLLLNVDGRYYDQMKIETVEETDIETITQIENFYFDITDCFGR